MRSSRSASLLVAILLAAAPGAAAAHGHGGGGHHAHGFYGFRAFGFSGFATGPYGSPFLHPAFGLRPFPSPYGPPGGPLIPSLGSAPLLLPGPPDEGRILESESGIEQQIRQLEATPDPSNGGGSDPSRSAAPDTAEMWKPL